MPWIWSNSVSFKLCWTIVIIISRISMKPMQPIQVDSIHIILIFLKKNIENFHVWNYNTLTFIFCVLTKLLRTWAVNLYQNLWTQWKCCIAITLYLHDLINLKSFGIWIFGSRMFRIWLNSHWVVLAILVGYLNSKFDKILELSDTIPLQCNRPYLNDLECF